jgi:hypothetical protein
VRRVPTFTARFDSSVGSISVLEPSISNSSKRGFDRARFFSSSFSRNLPKRKADCLPIFPGDLIIKPPLKSQELEQILLAKEVFAVFQHKNRIIKFAR